MKNLGTFGRHNFTVIVTPEFLELYFPGKKLNKKGKLETIRDEEMARLDAELAEPQDFEFRGDSPMEIEEE